MDVSNAMVATNRFSSARVCGACHREIFEEWSSSRHASAYTAPAFEAAFLKALYGSDGQAAELCLSCHSPTVAETNDVLGKEELTHEGVTCDYCHSTASIVEDPYGRMRHTIDHSSKYGRSNIPSPAAHAVARRAYFERSEICASCHEYSTADGTPISATFSEWRASTYAKNGTQCQGCHLPHSASPGIAPAGRTAFNDHNLQGRPSPSQITGAVAVRVEEAVRHADRMRIVVAVENSGAGHSVPTGMPSRKLVLVASATQQGRQIFHRETVYQRVMLGEDHRPLTEDWEIKLRSKIVLRDNRIRSGEVRRETFVFDAAASEDVVFKVRLAYRYEPTIAVRQRVEVPVAEIEQNIGSGL